MAVQFNLNSFVSFNCPSFEMKKKGSPISYNNRGHCSFALYRKCSQTLDSPGMWTADLFLRLAPLKNP